MEKFQFAKAGSLSRRWSRHIAGLTPPRRLVLAGSVVQETGVPEGDERRCGNVNTTISWRRGGVLVALPSCKAQILAGQHGALKKSIITVWGDNYLII